MHQPHGRHPQDQAAPARTGDEHPPGLAKVACHDRQLPVVEFGNSVPDLVPHKGQISGDGTSGVYLGMHRGWCWTQVCPFDSIIGL
jgi:hypothetical protein